MTSAEKNRWMDWYAGEAYILDKPMFIRFRRIPPKEFLRLPFHFLFVLTYHFKVSDETGLPSSDQYDQIAGFELSVIDKLESGRLGLAAFIETHRGTVRYYCYIDRVQDVTELINTLVDERTLLDLASDLDPNWNEYRRLLAQVKI